MIDLPNAVTTAFKERLTSGELRGDDATPGGGGNHGCGGVGVGGRRHQPGRAWAADRRAHDCADGDDAE